MHYFDPSLDWPKELLDETLPDLVVISSSNLGQQDAPWYRENGGWATAWISFAAAVREGRFMKMIFFDRKRAADNDRKEAVAYLNRIASRGDIVERFQNQRGGLDPRSLEKGVCFMSEIAEQ